MPRKIFDYDVIVIGAGIAGMVSAVTAASLGKRVAVIEKSRVGGNCTHSTCIPSKALSKLGRLSGQITHIRNFGIVGSCGDLDSRNLMSHIRNVVEKAAEKDLPHTFEKIGIHVISGAAAFLDPHRVQVRGKSISAANFIIAAGTSPLIPNLSGIADVAFLTNETLYELPELPRSMLILGAGVDGLEHASALGRLGVKTTVVGRGKQSLPGADGEFVNRLLGILEADGTRILTGVDPLKVESRNGRAALTFEKDGAPEVVEADRLLVTVGRQPDISGLDLQKAGVRYHSRGIVTDAKLRTSAPHIYACGDIVGPYQLASTAEAQAIVAARNTVFPVKRSVDYENIVFVIFTTPPLAYIGLTEQQARARAGPGVKVYRFEYASMRRAMIEAEEDGWVKVFCRKDGLIAGAHILGEAAEEVIHEFLVIKVLKIPLHKIYSVPHAYPTYAQALVGRASQLAFLERMEKSLLVRTGLSLFPNLSNRLHLARERLAEAPEKPAPPRKGGSATSATDPFPGRTCSITSRISEDATAILEFRGSLEASCEDALSRAYEEVLPRSNAILLNLSGLEHIDPEGAGLLLIQAVRAKRNGVSTAAGGLNAPVRDVFRLTRLDGLMAVLGDRGESLSEPAVSEPRLPAAPRSGHGGLLRGWAASVDYVRTKNIPESAMNINVHGRQTTSPVNGFGRLWDKKYRLQIDGAAPRPDQIMAAWKSDFEAFWPEGNHLFLSDGGSITPGATALLNLRFPGGLTMATGFMVMYVDDRSFSFITVQGHVISGWITFRSFRENSATVIQVHPTFRTSDALMETAFRLGGAEEEDRFWRKTLANLADRLGLRGEFQQESVLVDPLLQWNRWGNIWYNGMIRSFIYMPFYLFRRAWRRQKPIALRKDRSEIS